MPAATLLALVVHELVFKHEPPPSAQSWLLVNSYWMLLCAALGASILLAGIQVIWPGLRGWMREMCPILAGAVVLLAVWDIITSGFRLLPLPYFPAPSGVLQSMIMDRAKLFDSTWHSLILLAGGYTLGVAVALVTGVCIGWFAHARHQYANLEIHRPDSATA